MYKILKFLAPLLLHFVPRPRPIVEYSNNLIILNPSTELEKKSWMCVCVRDSSLVFVFRWSLVRHRYHLRHFSFLVVRIYLYIENMIDDLLRLTKMAAYNKIGKTLSVRALKSPGANYVLCIRRCGRFSYYMDTFTYNIVSYKYIELGCDGLGKARRVSGAFSAFSLACSFCVYTNVLCAACFVPV